MNDQQLEQVKKYECRGIDVGLRPPFEIVSNVDGKRSRRPRNQAEISSKQLPTGNGVLLDPSRIPGKPRYMINEIQLEDHNEHLRDTVL